MARAEAAPLTDRSGWKTHQLHEFVENVTDRVDDPSSAGVDRYVGLEHLDPDSLTIRRWGHPSDVIATKLLFRKGDIIFGRRRAYQRKLGVARFDGVCSAHALVLRPREDVVIPDFLPFFLQSDAFFSRALEISVGSLSPTINWRTLAKQEFALPPKPDQQHIAKLLWTVESTGTGVARAGRSIANVMKARVSDWFSASKEEKPLGDLADVRYGLTVNATRRSMPESYPYLRVANVMRGALDLREVKKIGCSESEVEQYRLRDGDVLVVEGHANKGEVGRAAIWRDEIRLCLHQNHILRVRSLEGLDSKYIASYLNSAAGRGYFRSRTKSTSGLNTINSSVLREMPVRLLRPAERADLLAELAAAERASLQVTHHLARLQRIKSSLMKPLEAGGLDDLR